MSFVATLFKEEANNTLADAHTTVKKEENVEAFCVKYLRSKDENSKRKMFGLVEAMEESMGGGSHCSQHKYSST